MPLGSLNMVRSLNAGERSKLMKSKSRIYIHEAGHIVALRRYNMAPYELKVSTIRDDEASIMPPRILYGRALKDSELLLCAGALMEKAVFGKWTIEGIKGDAEIICRNNSVEWVNDNTTSDILRRAENKYSDFPTDEEIEIAIRIHDDVEKKITSAPIVDYKKILTYKLLRSSARSNSLITDIYMLIYSIVRENYIKIKQLL